MDQAEMARATVSLAAGANLLCHACDQSVWDEVQQAASATEAAFGRIDILVNNAGIAGPAAPAAGAAEFAATGLGDELACEACIPRCMPSI